MMISRFRVIPLIALGAAFAVMAGCSQSNVKDLLSNVDKDCVIHGTFSAATGVPGNVTLAGTIDCAPNGVPPKAPGTAPSAPVVITPAPSGGS